MSSLRSIALAAMLLLSAIAGGPGVGTAAAAEAGQCSNLDDFIMFAYLGLVNVDSCSREAYVNAAITEMQQSDANQTEVDIYAAVNEQKAQQEVWSAPMDNYLNDTESVAWMKAQVAIAEAYQNNSTKLQAQQAARDAIADYYAVKEKNLVRAYEVTQSATLAARERAEQETGIDSSFVHLKDPQTSSGSITWTKINGTKNVTVTLSNGSEVTYESIHGEVDTDVSGPLTFTFDITEDPAWGPLALNDRKATAGGVEVDAPNEYYSPLTAFEHSDYATRWDRVQSKRSALQDEANNYVNGTWEDFDAGKINSSDVIDSHTAMFEYGTRSGNETESLWSSTAALSMMGFDTPNMTNSGVMTLSHNGGTYTGLVLARSAPNGTWESNTTYNTSNITGPVFFATTDGEKVDIGENETFTIESMTAKDGSDVQSIETTKYNYQTANTSELLALQGELLQLRQVIEDREANIGGGSSGSGTGLGNTQMIGIGAIAALLAVILLRD